MSVGGTATSGSNTSVSGSVVGGGRTGSQERGAWPGDSGLHLTHGHGLHLPQGPLQPHLQHQDDSKRRSRSAYLQLLLNHCSIKKVVIVRPFSFQSEVMLQNFDSYD